MATVTSDERKIHVFRSSGDAYNACQTDTEVRDNDILLIPSEEVVGIADTWPVAVTFQHQELHEVLDWVSWSSNRDFYSGDLVARRQAIVDAVSIADELGYRVKHSVTAVTHQA